MSRGGLGSGPKEGGGRQRVVGFGAREESRTPGRGLGKGGTGLHGQACAHRASGRPGMTVQRRGEGRTLALMLPQCAALVRATHPQYGPPSLRMGKSEAAFPPTECGRIAGGGIHNH